MPLVHVDSLVFLAVRFPEMTGEARDDDISRIVPLRLVPSLTYDVVEVVGLRFSDVPAASLAIMRAFVPDPNEKLGFGSVLLNPPNLARLGNVLRFLLPVIRLAYHIRTCS